MTQWLKLGCPLSLGNPYRGNWGEGGPLWFSQNESPVITANSILDSFNYVTLKSGSTLAFPFSFLCSPASRKSLGPPHPSPLTQRPPAWKFLRPPLGRSLRKPLLPFPPSRLFWQVLVDYVSLAALFMFRVSSLSVTPDDWGNNNCSTELANARVGKTSLHGDETLKVLG